jgi:hypothetical protein
MAQDPLVRREPVSASCNRRVHIVGLCVFSHQSADYNIVVAHLTSNIFEGHADTQRKKLSLDSNIYINYSKNNVPLKRCAHTGVTIMSNID